MTTSTPFSSGRNIQCVIYRKHHDKSRMAKTERGGERGREREEREREKGGRNIYNVFAGSLNFRTCITYYIKQSNFKFST